MNEEEFQHLATERANPRTRDLDLLTTEEMLKVINDEDRSVPDAVRATIPVLSKAIDRAAACLKANGTLHAFGAGTSGRLGVLDASEIPPTFGVPSSLFRAHLAGGSDAFFSAREGAEDDPELGARDVDAAGIRTFDFVVALSASGRTPYCLRVLEAARARGAPTLAIVCNRPTLCHGLADFTVDPLVGEEVLSGSTRMKAGTAQKLVLNMLSTGIMVKLGRTYGNLMVGVAATNHKLRERAARLVSEITGITRGVREALQVCNYDVRCACIMLKRNVTHSEAERILAEAEGFLRRAL